MLHLSLTLHISLPANATGGGGGKNAQPVWFFLLLFTTRAAPVGRSELQKHKMIFFLQTRRHLAAEPETKVNRRKLTGETFTPSRLERKRPPSNDSMLSATVAAKDIGLQAHPSPALDAGVAAGVLLWGDDEQRPCRGATLTRPIKLNLPRDTLRSGV